MNNTGKKKNEYKLTRAIHVGMYIPRCKFCYRELFYVYAGMDGYHVGSNKFPYCDSFCKNEYEMQTELRKIFTGKVNTIHYNTIKEYILQNNFITKKWIKEKIKQNNDNLYNTYIKYLRRDGIKLKAKWVNKNTIYTLIK